MPILYFPQQPKRHEAAFWVVYQTTDRPRVVITRRRKYADVDVSLPLALWLPRKLAAYLEDSIPRTWRGTIALAGRDFVHIDHVPTEQAEAVAHWLETELTNPRLSNCPEGRPGADG